MKELIDFKPEFDPTNKTLDFSDYPWNFNPDKLYAVINITQGVPLYVAGAPGLGITSFDKAGKKITLAWNTTSYSATDKLNIYYDTRSGQESNHVLEDGGNLQDSMDIQKNILLELRVMNVILAQGLNINVDDIDRLRADIFAIERVNH